MSRRALFTTLAMGIALSLTACAKPVPPLYSWGSYQPVIYDHLQGAKDGPEKQIAILEGDLEAARAKNAAVAPGIHAHLGLLYLTTGKTDQAQTAWTTEKTLFPEATRFIDFLLSKFSKKGEQTQ